MGREVKEAMLRELQEQFHDIRETGCVVVDYRGIKADQARQVREEARRRGALMTVVKNSLFSLAMERLGAAEVNELIAGPIAIVRAENPVLAAKVVEDLAQACEAITVRGGYVEGRVAGPADVERLARMPSRDELLSMVAGALLAPLRRLACGLMAKPRALLSVLEQMKEKAGAGEAEEPEDEQ
jgi:large subunit ribosomal protein L10